MIDILVIDANCDSIFTPEALELIRQFLGYFRILAPILLILLTSIDYANVVLSGDKDSVTKANGKVVKRVIATICLFFVPTFVNLSLNIASINGLTSDYMCSSATGTEAKKAVALIGGKEEEFKPNVNLNNGVVDIDDSNQNGELENGDFPSVGDYANVGNTVCLKDQAGLRDKYQVELESKVKKAGYNTRNGVVAAAIYISSEIGIKIPYFPAGCHSMSCLSKGIPNNIGCKTTVIHNKHKWPSTLPGGFDCSGFTFWAYGMAFGSSSFISSEMHNYSEAATKVYNPLTGKTVGVRVERVDISNKNIDYITNLLMPGDLVGTDGHVGMVISTDRLKSEGIYTVAHASSASMQLSVQDYKLAPNNKWGQVILMRKFFLKYDCLNNNNQESCQKFDCITNKSCDSNNIRY